MSHERKIPWMRKVCFAHTHSGAARCQIRPHGTEPKVFQSSRPGKVFCVTVVLSESLSRDQPRRRLSCLYASLCSSESYKISQCQDFNDGLEPLEARRYSRALQTQCLYHMTRCSCKFVNCQHVDLCKHHFDLTN